jgi:aspartate--ammonia ligase
LPNEITFISTKELEKKYPNLTRKEREDAIAKEFKAVFIYGIGWPLKDGKSHDGRAADYDDWKLNGDILLWFDTLGHALEISSMGIRVNSESLVRQLKHKKELYKLDNPYCTAIREGKLPLTIGGGIGQSRLCMFFLKKAHIGEVQASVWPEEMKKENEKLGIHLL